jgi:hypothetical protein
MAQEPVVRKEILLEKYFLSECFRRHRAQNLSHQPGCNSETLSSGLSDALERCISAWG